jgi:L-serine kinase (ADP)
MLEISKIASLKPLEMVFPSHLANLSKMIISSGVVTSPIIADKKTGVVLDGSHRYIFFLSNGYTEVPVKFVNYMDENIRVGTNLMHRHIDDGQTGISKEEVIRRGLSGEIYPPRTTRNFFPFRKNAFTEIKLSDLNKSKPINVDHYIAKVDVDYEVNHNLEYLEEIEFEIDEIIRYLDEIRMTRLYLKRQIEEMKK